MQIGFKPLFLGLALQCILPIPASLHADSAYERAVEIKPDYAFAHYNLGGLRESGEHGKGAGRS